MMVLVVNRAALYGAFTNTVGIARGVIQSFIAFRVLIAAFTVPVDEGVAITPRQREFGGMLRMS